MKKTIILVSCLGALAFVAACCRCEVEPIVEQNRKLVVPPNFGNKPN
jgi:hypothetical protein